MEWADATQISSRSGARILWQVYFFLDACEEERGRVLASRRWFKHAVLEGVTKVYSILYMSTE